MRTETITKEIYQFDELSDDAKETARTWFRETYNNEEWWDLSFDDFNHVADILGIDIDNIFFSGFSCQGDGAQFTGSYSYNPGSVKAIKSHCPKDTDLHDIATGLYKLQRPWFYSLSANVKSSGRYSHEMCTSFDIESDTDLTGYDRNILEAEEQLTDLLRDFMRWIYKSLESEYWYLMSNESVDENIRINDYEFEVDGSCY